MHMKEMFVNQVGIAVGGHPVVLLSEQNNSETALPIFIGSVEAAAISLAMTKTKMPRPMTHDLLLDIIESLGGKVSSVQIMKLSESTYHARLCITTATGESVDIDCRPSDGIATALRANSPILVDPEIASGNVVKIGHEKDAGANSINEEEFREFIGNVKASDFCLPHLQSDVAKLKELLETESESSGDRDQPPEDNEQST